MSEAYLYACWIVGLVVFTMVSFYIVLVITSNRGNALLGEISRPKNMSRFVFLVVSMTFLMCNVYAHIMRLISLVLEYHNDVMLHLVLAFLFIFSRNGLFFILRPHRLASNY